VLICDDEMDHALTLVRLLDREGFDAHAVHHVAAAMESLQRDRYDIILTDLVMPGHSGMDLLRAVQHLGLEVDIILMTAFGTVERAVDAMRSGAEDFLVKPIRKAHLQKSIQRVLERRTLARENVTLREQLEAVTSRSGLVGSSVSFTRAMRLAEQAAASEATILLYGESGTGKELAARHIHARSSRASGPFVPVHCAALPESIIESELFGYEPGAFTGATRRRQGRLESADHGTLFLDEVGELPLSVQVKLLRMLQEGEIQRLGSNATIRVDVRILAATHRDLEAMVAAGEFREDLFYRLNVIPVVLPPLRERASDLDILIQHFLARSALQNARPVPRLSLRAQACLVAWRWPGNVRELQNVLERAVVLDTDSIIDVDDLPQAIVDASNMTQVGGGDVTFAIGTPLAEVERRMILATLEHTGGDKALAASILGVGRRTIYRKLDEFADVVPDDSDR
jgi:two-component system response regulator HydG